MKIITILNSYSQQGGEPLWYTKADTALLRNNDAFYLPGDMGRVVAEPHIVVRISRLAKCIGERFAPRCYDEVLAGVTFTAVDLLAGLRAEGLPWERAVGFDHSSALSNEAVPRDALLSGASFSISDRGPETIDASRMRFTVDRVVSCLSHAMTLRIGDLIYLGAPERFEVHVGDNCRMAVGGRTLLDFDIR